MIFLIMGSIWLICGVGMLIYQTLSGDESLTMHILGKPLSAGWVMLVLAGYNYVRWWARRPARSRQQMSQLSARRQRIRRIEEPKERNPNFIFTDDPPAPPPLHDQPPSQN